MEDGFRDRADAGAKLAERLMPLRDRNPIVVALPRGGVPVARPIATALGAPLEVIAVRKLGAPGNPELGMGAIAEDGTGVIDQATVRALGVSDEQLQFIIARESAELARRVALYRGERPAFDLAGRTVIVVDDGVATGVTDTAALRAIRSQKPERLVLAVPVCARGAVGSLAAEADEIVTLLNPLALDGVGRWYRDFSQVTDEEVLRLLHSSNGNGGPDTREVTVEVEGISLPGSLFVPADPIGIVLFAHGSGSSRHSPRNVAVARRLHGLRLSTLLFDLLTEEEARDRDNVFAVELLGRPSGRCHPLGPRATGAPVPSARILRRQHRRRRGADRGLPAPLGGRRRGLARRAPRSRRVRPARGEVTHPAHRRRPRP